MNFKQKRNPEHTMAKISLFNIHLREWGYEETDFEIDELIKSEGAIITIVRMFVSGRIQITVKHSQKWRGRSGVLHNGMYENVDTVEDLERLLNQIAY